MSTRQRDRSLTHVGSAHSSGQFNSGLFCSDLDSCGFHAAQPYWGQGWYSLFLSSLKQDPAAFGANCISFAYKVTASLFPSLSLSLFPPISISFVKWLKCLT